MKQPLYRPIVTGIAVLLFTAMAYADTRYVIDKTQITFRTGPGNDRKILSLLNSGESVSFLQSEDEWAKVSLQSGKEGWVLQRYLTPEVPCRTRIEEVNQTLERLKTELDTAKKTHQEINADKTRLTTDLKNTRQELADTQRSYQKLKKDAAAFLELKARHEKTVERLTKQTQKAATLDEDLTKTLKKQNIRWFLGGAGVLLLGFILGFGSKKQKRHSSLL
jgi:SH3 domain protein